MPYYLKRIRIETPNLFHQDTVSDVLLLQDAPLVFPVGAWVSIQEVEVSDESLDEDMDEDE